MDEKLKNVINDYIRDVNNVCLIMLKGLGLKSKEDMINYRVLNPSGEFELIGRHHYVFHGRGCRFHNDGIKIDWDFGINDTWCGLNPWLVADYIKDNNKNITEYQDGEILKSEFNKAVVNKEMRKEYQLYYLLPHKPVYQTEP